MTFKNETVLVQNGSTVELKKKRKDILDLLAASIHTVNPYRSVGSCFKEGSIILPEGSILLKDFSKIYIVAFGKASIGMTKGVIDQIKITKGIVITNNDSLMIKEDNIQTFYGSHPLPNQDSVKATKMIEELLTSLSKNDLLIVLISGGGSALLCHPRISLSNMRKTTLQLLQSGATIQELNTIRKHLSYVKGGQLIKGVKGRVISFIISDVVNDPVEFIASGPTAGDKTTFKNAYDIFQKYQLWDTIPKSTQAIISKGIQKDIPETPDASDPLFQRVTNLIVANNSYACETILLKAKSLGYHPFIFSTSLQGEARDTAKKIIQEFLSYKNKGIYDLFIVGGETTVTVRGNGKGGRNQEMVLASLEYLQKHNLVFASFGTDGIDGMSHAAGAIADGNTLSRAKTLNMDSLRFLKNNDSNTFFQKLQDEIITGKTGTNVMDIQILISY